MACRSLTIDLRSLTVNALLVTEENLFNDEDLCPIDAFEFRLLCFAIAGGERPV